jgi:hypothetical protein
MQRIAMATITFLGVTLAMIAASILLAISSGLIGPCPTAPLWVLWAFLGGLCGAPVVGAIAAGAVVRRTRHQP